VSAPLGLMLGNDSAAATAQAAGAAVQPAAKADLAHIGAETTRSREGLEALMRTMKSTQSMIIQSQEPQRTMPMPGKSEAARE
jgi:hypothetical protein